MFAVATAWQTSRTAARAARASEVSGQYQDAQSALAAEQAREHEYRRFPSPVTLRVYVGSTAEFRARLAVIGSAPDESDRRVAERVRKRHGAYEQAAREILAAAVAGRESSMTLQDSELAFRVMSVILGDAASDRSASAAHRVASLRADEGFLLWATPIVFGIGLFLLWLFAHLLRGYQRALHHQASHDSLTGLPNREMFGARVAAAVDRAAETGEEVAVLLLDLDDFKEINDTLGHRTGDQLLTNIGPRLRGAIRDGDLIARLGGDEFAVLVSQRSGEYAGHIANRIIAALREPVVVDGLALVAEATIGIARYPQDGVTAGELLQRADVAMYAAKESRAGIASYTPSMDERDSRKLSRMPELRRALNEDELVLHYQPLVDLETGRLRGVEALVRWEHPAEGLLPPSEFVPLAESTGLIHDMTRHVLTLAAEQAGAWLRAGEAVPMAVNLSTRCLLDATLPDMVKSVLAAAGVPPGLLTLEITESAIMADLQRSLEVLTRLEGLGVRIAIDDFGTGYTSMAYLRDLPIHELKIDRTFVSRMVGESKDAIIVHTAIDLAHRLGLTTVAEGVEDESTWTALADLDCDIAQGYHVGRPMAADKFAAWLDDWRAARVS
jgi:diguanylate cyclase (GGDEF)-like protein